MEVNAYIEGVTRASQLLRENKTDEAKALSRELVNARPERYGAYVILAQAQLVSNEGSEAEETLKSGLEMTDAPQLSLNLAIVRSRLGKFEEAVADFRKLDLDDTGNEQAFFNFARSLIGIEKIADGIEQYKKCLTINPVHKGALNNLANLYQKNEHYNEAIKLYITLTENFPHEAMGFSNLGGLYEKLNKPKESVNCYKKALAINPKLSIAWYNLGHLYATRFNDHQRALEIFETGLKKGEGPFRNAIRFHQILSRQHIINWSEYEKDTRDLHEIILKYIDDPHPLFEVVPYNLSYSKVQPDLFRKVAGKYASRIIGKNKSKFPQLKYDHSLSEGKIRIGYYSPNFKIHPGGILIHKLLDLHNSSTFEIHVFSLTHADDFVNDEVQRTADYYHNVSDLSSEEIANLINRTGIDILVALAGYNASMKMDVLALRPAPIQMLIIGSHETTGAPFIDYVFSDEYMMDKSLRENFSENVITLPCSLLLNSALPLDTSISTKKMDHNLPEEAFVFAAFNHPKKLDPGTFNCWLEILKAVPDSVLWLYDGGSGEVRKSVRSYAEKKAGVSERIVFAAPMEIHKHWERFKHADLFLDNFIYNAHVTAIEALRQGKPIITLRGNNHNSRLCSSMLHYAGLEELISDSESQFIKTAISLAENRERLKEISKKLASDSLCLLFDSKIQIKYLEKAYRMAFSSAKKDGQFKDLIVGSLLKFDSID
ncbi:MAG: tetratricopeptide repeat protein [Cyclobacteriaceae bacterium]